MAKKVKKTKLPETFKMSALCGITTNRAGEIVHAIRHAKLDVQTWQELAEMVKKTARIKGEGDNMFFGFILGKEMTFEDMMDLPKILMDKLVKHK